MGKDAVPTFQETVWPPLLTLPFYLTLVFFLASASSKMADRRRKGVWAGREGAWVKWVVGGAQAETPPKCVRQCTSSTWCNVCVCVRVRVCVRVCVCVCVCLCLCVCVCVCV
jgi:hypothetical protein